MGVCNWSPDPSHPPHLLHRPALRYALLGQREGGTAYHSTDSPAAGADLAHSRVRSTGCAGKKRATPLPIRSPPLRVPGESVASSTPRRCRKRVYIEIQDHSIAGRACRRETRCAYVRSGRRGCHGKNRSLKERTGICKVPESALARFGPERGWPRRGCTKVGSSNECYAGRYERSR